MAPALPSAVPGRKEAPPEQPWGGTGTGLGAALGEVSGPLKDLLFVCLGVFFFAGQAAEQSGWLQESGDRRRGWRAQVPPRGPACSTRDGRGGTKERTAGLQKKLKKKKKDKKKKKKKDTNSLGNPRPQGRERVQGTTAHVTGDRQTDSPVPIRYVKYHHSGTLTDL